MKVKISLLLFAIAILLSCSKKDNTTEVPEQISKVKKVASGSESVSYTYDANGRVTSEIITANQSIATYTYLTGEIKKTFTDLGSSYTYFLTLNSDGLMIKSTSTVNTNTIEYTYNADKTKSSEKLTFPTYGLRFDYFYSNGNIDSIRHFDETGRLTNTTYYSYYLDQPQKLSYSSFGADYYGKDTRNMLKSKKNSYATTSYLQENYEYTYDSNGRVATKKTTYINGGSITNTSTLFLTYY